MRFDVVRLLRPSFVLLFLTCLISLHSFAQNAQAAPQSQPAPQQPAQAEPESPAEEQAPAASPTAAPQPAEDKDRPFKIKIVPQKPQQKPLKTLDDRVLIKDAQGIPLGMREQLEKATQKALQEAMERNSVQPYHLLGDNQPGSFDRGIYARQVDGANVCGSIMSYNFSLGANPQLESVTTCTPSNAVTSKRAGVPDKKPEGPHVLQAVERPEEKK
jgi:flagellar motor protein MotB